MKAKVLPTQGYLHECFEITPTGLRWRERPEHHFPSIYQCKSFNAQRAGTPVGSLKKDGYLRVSLDKVSFPLHRIVYKMEYDYEPAVIDHIDQNRRNNSVANLRAATHAQNSKNQKLRVTNKSGYKGVSWKTSANKFQATIGHQGRNIHLGYFNTPEIAHVAYMAKAVELGGAFGHGG